MYEELVTRLRRYSAYNSLSLGKREDMTAAADAIEILIKRLRSAEAAITDDKNTGSESVTVNQFVCLFPSGTRIKVHMIFADREKTERLNDEDFGVWGDGEYYGITRYPVGGCTVSEARMLKPLINGHRYDLDVWAFEPKYCENLAKQRKVDDE